MMKKTLYGLAAAVLLTVPVASSEAALNAYLSLKGTKTASFTPDAPSGLFQALCTNEVLAMARGNTAASEIVSPRDPATGQATGRRKHEPIRLIRSYDKASPLLARAAATGEHIKEVKILLCRDLPGGMIEWYGQITLTDCLITEIAPVHPDRNGPGQGPGKGFTQADLRSLSSGGDRPMESLSLNFTKIEFSAISGQQKKSDVPLKATYDIKKNVKV